MATLQELRARKVYTSNTWVSGSKLIVISGLGGVASHLLYNLLFRLENTPNGATVVLYDESESGDFFPVVSEEDVKAGLYTPSDRGRIRRDVLIERYTEVFSTNLIAGSQQFLMALEDGMPIANNVFFLDLTDSGDTILQRCFDELAKQGRNRSGEYATAYFRAFTDGETSVVHARVLGENGRVSGDSYNYAERIGEGIGLDVVPSCYVRNQAVSMYLFNYLNALMSEGMFVEVARLEGDILGSEEQVNRVYFEAPFVTIFDTYEVNVGVIDRELLVSFRDTWDACHREVLDDVYEPFMARFNVHRGLKYAKAGEYLLSTCYMLEHGMRALGRKRTQSELSNLLVTLVERLSASHYYAISDVEGYEEYVKTMLTFIQFAKRKGLWFI